MTTQDAPDREEPGEAAPPGLGPPAGPELPAGSPLDAAQAALGVMPKQITLPLPPWLGPLAVCCALGIVPWVVYLAVTLPGRQRAVDYDIAWVGYDAVMGGDGGARLLRTATQGGYRRDRRGCLDDARDRRVVRHRHDRQTRTTRVRHRLGSAPRDTARDRLRLGGHQR
ncbi:MAG TPA: hypothetical protein VIM17_00655 [Jatrophihabitantaceae bacterium]